MSSTEQAVAVKSEPAKQVPASQPWPQWWQVVALAALIGFAYHRVLTKLVTDWWNDPNFSHGFFVPLFSGYLLWQERERLKQIPIRPSWLGLVVMLGGVATLLVGVFGVELFLSRASLVLLLGGMVIYFLGWAMFRAVLFPWLFLFLMIPIPNILFNQITIPLQMLASKVAAAVLPVFGVPVLREGNIIRLPAMPLEVAEACSGIRSLMSLGTLALMYGYFLDSKTWRRAMLALASVPIAVAANASRIVGTGVLVQYWDPDKALGFFHEFSGWLIFIVSLALLFGVHGLIRLLPGDKPKPAR